MNLFSDYKTIFAYKYEQTSAPSTGAEVRNKFINLARKNIARRIKWSWLQKPGTGTTDGTRYLDLASDLGYFGLVRLSFRIDDAEWTEILQGDENLYSSSAKVFYVIGNPADGYQAYFPNATPETGLAVTYRYFQELADLADDSDPCPLPDAEAVCDLAIAMYFKSEGEFEDADVFMEDAENGIDEMGIQEVKRKPKQRLRNAISYYGRDSHNVKNMYQ